MATRDSAEECVVLSPMKDTRGRRQGKARSLHSGGTSAQWPDVFGWMVGFCLSGPVDRREMPIGLRAWLDVVDFVGSAPYFAMDIQFYPEAGPKQLGW